MKFWAGVLASLLVVSPKAEPGTVHYETIVQTEYIEKDSYPRRQFQSPSVEEAERQGLCLWEFMRQRDIDITLNNVLVSGEWTDIRGGACYLIGEDDEPLAQVHAEEPS